MFRSPRARSERVGTQSSASSSPHAGAQPVGVDPGVPGVELLELGPFPERSDCGQGADLRAAGVVEFLDGWQKMVLVIRGKAPPASLARLVSPQVFVAQAAAADGLALVAELAKQEGTGIVALFDGDAGGLPFVHRPGMALEVDRDDLTALLDVTSRKRGQPGILDLRHLESLTGLPGPVQSGSGKAGEKTVDQLAAWLLSRTDLDG